MARDPICGKTVDELRARAVGIFSGRTYYFCSPEHKAEFARDPSRAPSDGDGVVREAAPSSGAGSGKAREGSGRSGSGKVRDAAPSTGSGKVRETAPSTASSGKVREAAPGTPLTVEPKPMSLTEGGDDATPLPAPAPGLVDGGGDDDATVQAAGAGRSARIYYALGLLVLAAIVAIIAVMARK